MIVDLIEELMMMLNLFTIENKINIYKFNCEIKNLLKFSSLFSAFCIESCIQ